MNSSRTYHQLATPHRCLYKLSRFLFTFPGNKPHLELFCTGIWNLFATNEVTFQLNLQWKWIEVYLKRCFHLTSNDEFVTCIFSEEGVWVLFAKQWWNFRKKNVPFHCCSKAIQCQIYLENVSTKCFSSIELNTPGSLLQPNKLVCLVNFGISSSYDMNVERCVKSKYKNLFN